MCLNDAEECVIIYTSDLKDEEGDRKWVAMSECMDRGEDKEFGKKLPLGCLIIGGIFLFIVIKACNEMKEEEKKKQQFQEEMKKKNEEQTREWQEMHGIYKENVYETK